MIPRPLQHLNAVMSLYPRAGHLVDEFRSSRGVDLPHWPDWCFLPMAAWHAIVCEGNATSTLGLDLIGDVSSLAAIGTWRYSQGIYQVDPDLMKALTDSTVSGSLPSEVLHRLPEWSLYIATPGGKWFLDDLHGFWVHLEWDANTGRTELRFLFDCESCLFPLPLHIGAWTVTEAVDRAVSEARKQARILGLTVPDSAVDLVQQMSAEINPMVSVVLYLCSEEPEIDDTKMPGAWPARPRPKKTKKGWRLFPAEKPRVWTVGAETGVKLREAQHSGQTGKTIKAHLRRGHWHGYWTGPRQEERKFIYHWISPLLIRGSEKP